MEKIILKIAKTHCPACKKLIEKRILTIPGVKSVDVNYETGVTQLQTLRKIPKEEIKKVLSDTHYEIE